jgi:hypothetical protein
VLCSTSHCVLVFRFPAKFLLEVTDGISVEGLGATLVGSDVAIALLANRAGRRRDGFAANPGSVSTMVFTVTCEPGRSDGCLSSTEGLASRPDST